MMENFQLLLLCLQFVTVFFIFFSANPMYSVLCMILFFFESAIVIAFFTLEFFALAFVIVYVGAVAILFLFVVMLLETKMEFYNLFLSTQFCFIIGLFIFFKSYNYFISYFYNAPLHVNGLELAFDYIDETTALGQLLYNYFLPCVLIVGFILLFAIFGAIFLTFNFNITQKRKYSAAFRRLSRSSNFLAFFQ